MPRNIIALFALLFVIAACRDNECPSDCSGSNLNINFEAIPAWASDGIANAVIEIPAGTNHKIEYDKEKKEFINDIKDGKIRIVDFLPYPGNYGFIPSTYMDPAIGGDGDALDVLVIAEAMSTGSVVEIIPIAMAELVDGGETDTKIIAVPANPDQRIITAVSLNELEQGYPAVKEIIEKWFLSYKGPGEMEINGWASDSAAVADIKRWAVE